MVLATSRVARTINLLLRLTEEGPNNEGDGDNRSQAHYDIVSRSSAEWPVGVVAHGPSLPETSVVAKRGTPASFEIDASSHISRS